MTTLGTLQFDVPLDFVILSGTLVLVFAMIIFGFIYMTIYILGKSKLRVLWFPDDDTIEIKKVSLKDEHGVIKLGKGEYTIRPHHIRHYERGLWTRGTRWVMIDPKFPKPLIVGEDGLQPDPDINPELIRAWSESKKVAEIVKGGIDMWKIVAIMAIAFLGLGFIIFAGGQSGFGVP